MGKYFGTDGFRGEANVALTARHAYEIGRYLGKIATDRAQAQQTSTRGTIVIGRDTRLSGTMYESALAAGITASGCNATLLGVVTTPGVAMITREKGFNFGIMISASHNPYMDNGIKVLNERGEKMDEETILQIEAYIDGEIPEFPFAEGEQIGEVVQDTPELGLKQFYADQLVAIGQCPFNERIEKPFAGYNIALDCSCGSASEIAEQVFTQLGATVTALYTDYNGVNINNGCGSTHPEKLMAYVAEHPEINAGFAYDGDADRCQAVDAEGNLLDGDKIMYLGALWLRENNALANNTVVTTVMSNLGLYKALDAEGIAYEKTAVGDKYVYENMAANGHRIGGEQSGHVIYGQFATTGDGILTSIMTMRAVLAGGKPIGELAAPMKTFPQVLKNMRVKDKAAAQADEAVQAAIAAAGEALGDNGRVLVRASGTEQLIRVMVEAATPEECQQHVDAICTVIEQRGLIQ